MADIPDGKANNSQTVAKIKQSTLTRQTLSMT